MRGRGILFPDHHLGTEFGERLGDAPADAGAAAGDDGYSAIEGRGVFLQDHKPPPGGFAIKGVTG